MDQVPLTDGASRLPGPNPKLKLSLDADEEGYESVDPVTNTVLMNGHGTEYFVRLITIK